VSYKRLGDLGVAAAINSYMQRGNVVAFPLTDTARYDLIVDVDGQLLRVEVKTTQALQKSGNYEVSLRTMGGNQSWSGETKTIDPSECDIVFVHSPAGNYEFPSVVLKGRKTITLCDKYAEFLWE